MSAFSTLRNVFLGPRKPHHSPRLASRRRIRRPRFECLEERTCLSGTWATVAPMPTPRFLLSAAADPASGLIYAVGGQEGVCPDSTRNEVYNPADNTWATKAPMPSPHAAGGAAVVNGILYAIGGQNGCGSNLNTMDAYNPATDTWTAKAPVRDQAALNFGVGVVNGTIYLVGGGNGSGFLAQTYAYDPGTNTWTSKAPYPGGVAAPATGVVNGIIYVAGGQDSSGQPIKKVEAYDPATDTWTAKADMPTARMSLAGSVVGGQLYALGGSQVGLPHWLATVEVYDPTTNTWTTDTPMPTARSELAAATVNGVIYAIGGVFATTNPPSRLATNEAFTPAVMPTLTLAAANAVYNGSAYATSNITPALTPVTAVGTTTYTFYSDAGGTNVIPDPTNAGTYYVKGHFASSDLAQWSDADSSIVGFTIAQAALSVTANNASKTYDGLAYSGGNGVSFSGFVNGETETVLGGTLVYGGNSQGAVDAGTYVITPGGLTSGNYDITFNNGTLTVNKAALTGIATTQSALNYLAKQGSFTIALSSISGLQGSDTVASVFASAVFTLNIDSNLYAFEPSVSVDSVTNAVYLTYTLRGGTAAGDALRNDLALLDASDGTGVSTSASKASVDAFWVYADSTNYTFADDCPTRLFAASR